MSLVTRVKRLCADAGVSLNRFEKDSGVGRGSVSKWDSSVPSSEKIAKAATYFGISPDYFLGDETTSHIAYLAFKLDKLDKIYKTMPDGEEKDMVGSNYDRLMDEYQDLTAMRNVGIFALDKKMPAPSEGDGQIPSDFAAIYNQLSPERRAEVDRHARLLLLEQQTQEGDSGFQE